MNRTPQRFSVGIILSCLLIALAAQAGDLRVTRMPCDHRENPLGVDAAKPQLSWRMESGESVRNLRSDPDVQLLRLEKGCAALDVASGRYEFESQVK
jgi:hypothetical protein